jgi:hypothetical protein
VSPDLLGTQEGAKHDPFDVSEILYINVSETQSIHFNVRTTEMFLGIVDNLLVSLSDRFYEHKKH